EVGPKWVIISSPIMMYPVNKTLNIFFSPLHIRSEGKKPHTMTCFWRKLKYCFNKPLLIYNDSITYEDFVNSSFSAHSYDLSNGDYDVKIEVGEEPNVRIVWAHSSILKERSIYFKVALSGNWTRKQNGIIIFKKPNLRYEVF